MRLAGLVALDRNMNQKRYTTIQVPPIRNIPTKLSEEVVIIRINPRKTIIRMISSSIFVVGLRGLRFLRIKYENGRETQIQTP
jgi:hypothetical protein